MSSELINQLVHRFEVIGRERIRGLPIYNEKLAVEAVGFQPCEGGQIGGLVTPWFVNIMLLPENSDDLQLKELGVKIKYDLPSGECEFTIGEEDVLGRYLFRSVVSPTHCYKKQAPACSTVSKALNKLMTAPSETNAEAELETKAETTSEDQPDQSRREFLRHLKNPVKAAAKS